MTYIESETLEELYVDQRMTQDEVADEVGVGASTVRYWLRYHDIEIRSRTSTEYETGNTFDMRHGSDFKAIRSDVLERSEYRCEECGLADDEHRQRDDLFPPNGGLHIHHKIPTTEFDDPADAHVLSNLVSLCAECHEEKNRKGA